MAGFKVKIGADTVELTKSLGQLQKDLAQFKKQLSGVTNAQEFIRLNQAIAQTERQIKGLTGAQNINALGQSIKQVTPGFNQAGFAVGNFARVVQDAPFALLQGNLIAVSNNIDPLVQSFVQLKQQTGSSGAALKALASNLMGSGGLLLGFSLVNAAITFFSARATFAKEKTKELSETIRDSATVTAQAAASTAGQIAQINALATTVSDTNAAYADRKRALEELKEINKSYFGDLQLEDAATGRLTSTIQEYSKAIINAAIQKEFASEIAKVAKAAADADLELIKATTRLTNAEKDLATARAESRPTGREGTAISAAEADAQDALNDAFEKQRAAREKVTDLLTDQALLTNSLNKAVKEGLKVKDLDTAKTEKETDALKQRIDALKQLQSEVGLSRAQQIDLAQLEIQLATRDSIKLKFTPEELQQRIQGIIDRSFPNEGITSRLKIRILGEIDPSQVQTDIQNQTGDISNALGITKIDTAAFDPMIQKMKEASAAKNELLKLERLKEMGDFIVGTLQPAFTDLFESLISGGKNAFQELAQALGQIIKRLIAAAAAAALLAGIVTLITGGSAAGAASFGANFKSIFGGFTGFQFADGGIATRATRGVFGEAGPEAVMPLAKLPQIMGSLNFGGGIGGEFTARIVDGGRDLFLIMNKASKTMNRNF